MRRRIHVCHEEEDALYTHTHFSPPPADPTTHGWERHTLVIDASQGALATH